MNSVEVKSNAKDLKVIASKYGYEIKHSHALEILSQLNNKTNWHVTSAKKEESSREFIKTGISRLDELLQGGLNRGAITAILADRNVGKSLFGLSLVCNALRANQKVLIFSLLDQKKSVEQRILSNLTNIEYGRIINDQLSEEERAKINEIRLNVFESRLVIKSDFNFNYSIEALSNDVFNTRTAFKFDFFFIDDYSNLTTNSGEFNRQEKSSLICRQLNKIAIAYDSVVLLTISVQKLSEGKEIIRSTDMTDDLTLARFAAIILSLNMTDDERSNHEMRVYLEKQRFGMKGLAFTLKTKYSICNLIG